MQNPNKCLVHSYLELQQYYADDSLEFAIYKAMALYMNFDILIFLISDF